MLKVPGRSFQLFFSFAYLLLEVYIFSAHSPYASFSFRIRDI